LPRPSPTHRPTSPTLSPQTLTRSPTPANNGASTWKRIISPAAVKTKRNPTVLEQKPTNAPSAPPSSSPTNIPTSEPTSDLDAVCYMTAHFKQQCHDVKGCCIGHKCMPENVCHTSDSTCAMPLDQKLQCGLQGGCCIKEACLPITDPRCVGSSLSLVPTFVQKPCLMPEKFAQMCGAMKGCCWGNRCHKTKCLDLAMAEVDVMALNVVQAVQGPQGCTLSKDYEMRCKHLGGCCRGGVCEPPSSGCHWWLPKARFATAPPSLSSRDAQKLVDKVRLLRYQGKDNLMVYLYRFSNCQPHSPQPYPHHRSPLLVQQQRPPSRRQAMGLIIF
jgi:hypothetical protein